MKTWIKICGMTNAADARAAVELGADAIGLIFVPSARQVTVAQAAEITAELPWAKERIGVFVNARIEEVVATTRSTRLTGVQLHGDESPEYLAQLRSAAGELLKIIKTTGIAHLASATEYRAANFVLIDSGSAEQRGGTGQTFDWTTTKKAVKELQKSIPVIVAGGLRPDNVRDALCTFRPTGVDVCTGVELSPGTKDQDKLRRFINTVRDFDAGRSSCPPIA